jgi:hypothetical protein
MACKPDEASWEVALVHDRRVHVHQDGTRRQVHGKGSGWVANSPIMLAAMPIALCTRIVHAGGQ